MLIAEILVVIVILAFIANGYKAGAIETLGRLVGSIIGFIIARKFSGFFAGIISLFLSPEWASLGSFIFIFMLVDYLIGILFKIAGTLLKIFTRLPIIKQINNALGAFLGFFEAVIVIGGISWLLSQSAQDAGAMMLSELQTVQFIDKVFNAVILTFL